jgi:hypothetical protein
MRDVTGANYECVRSAWPQGNFEPPEGEFQRPSVPRTTAASVPSVRERKRRKQCNPQWDCRLMRLLAKSNRARRKRPSPKSSDWSVGIPWNDRFRLPRCLEVMEIIGVQDESLNSGGAAT